MPSNQKFAVFCCCSLPAAALDCPLSPVHPRLQHTLQCILRPCRSMPFLPWSRHPSITTTLLLLLKRHILARHNPSNVAQKTHDQSDALRYIIGAWAPVFNSRPTERRVYAARDQFHRRSGGVSSETPRRREGDGGNRAPMFWRPNRATTGRRVQKRVQRGAVVEGGWARSMHVVLEWKPHA